MLLGPATLAWALAMLWLQLLQLPLRLPLPLLLLRAGRAQHVGGALAAVEVWLPLPMPGAWMLPCLWLWLLGSKRSSWPSLLPLPPSTAVARASEALAG